MPLVFRRHDVESLLPIDRAIELARESFLALARGEANMPQRLATFIPEHEGTHLSMPCYVRAAEREILTVKVVTIFSRNADVGQATTQGSLLIHDPQTGALAAIMDAEALTAIRTAGASAVAADLLALPGPQTLGLFGAGGQAPYQVEGMLQVRPIDRILIHSKTRQRSELLARQTAEKFDIECQVVDSGEEVARHSKLIVCATNSVKPVLKGDWLQPGTHISAIGAFRPDMAELDVEAVGRSRVVVDRLQAAQNGAGDLIQAVASGRLLWDDVVEIGAVLTGQESFERSSEDITVFKSVGTAVQDAFAADYVYREALETGVGSRIDLD